MRRAEFFGGDGGRFGGPAVGDERAVLVGATSCLAPDDLSAYWFPTMFNGNTPVIPGGKQVIYYKSGIIDHAAVRPFPPGTKRARPHHAHRLRARRQV